MSFKKFHTFRLPPTTIHVNIIYPVVFELAGFHNINKMMGRLLAADQPRWSEISSSWEVNWIFWSQDVPLLLRYMSWRSQTFGSVPLFLPFSLQPEQLLLCFSNLSYLVCFHFSICQDFKLSSRCVFWSKEIIQIPLLPLPAIPVQGIQEIVLCSVTQSRHVK